MQFCDVFAIEKRCHQIVSTHPVSTEHFWLLLTCFAIYIGYLFIGFDGISSKIYLGNGSVSQFSLFIPSGLLARATDILLLAKGVCISVITPSQLFIFWSFHLRPKKVRKVTSVYQAPSQFFDLLNFSLSPRPKVCKALYGPAAGSPCVFPFKWRGVSYSGNW